MERVILCLNTELSIILEFISSKSFGGNILQLSTGRIIYSFYSVNEADFVSSGDHIQTTYRDIYGNKLATLGKQKVEEQRKLRAISGRDTFEAFH